MSSSSERALQAFLQTFVAEHILTSEQAQEKFEQIEQRYEAAPGPDVKTCIAQLNEALGQFHLQIRTIKLPGGDNQMCHGLVNTKNDEISKTFGSALELWEAEFFKNFVTESAQYEDGQVHENDLLNLRTKNNAQDAEKLRDKLLQQKWLERGRRAHYKLGWRTYLELPELLRNAEIDMPQEIILS